MLDVSITASASYEQWQWRAHLNMSEGQADYDGQTQTGIPHKTVTEELIFNNLIAARRPVYQQGQWQLSLGTGVGYRYWERAIMPQYNPISDGVVNGLYEEYRWLYLLADSQLQYRRNNHSFQVNLGLLRPIDPKVEVALNQSFSLEMHAKFGYQMGASWAYQTGSWRWSAGIDHKRWRFDASNVVDIISAGQPVGVLEPENDAIITRYYLSLGWQF